MSQLTIAAPPAPAAPTAPLPPARPGPLNAFGSHLARVFAGEEPRPPFAEHLDLGGVLVERGRVVFSLEVQPFHLNPLGTLHGGVIATLLDTAMGCAVHTTLDDDTLYSTGDLSVRYLRPVRLGDRVEAEGVVIHSGRRTVTAEARIVAVDARVAATGSSTCVLLR
jgi:uncharacterized protein (TIGR00369 family)